MSHDPLGPPTGCPRSSNLSRNVSRRDLLHHWEPHVNADAKIVKGDSFVNTLHGVNVYTMYYANCTLS